MSKSRSEKSVNVRTTESRHFSFLTFLYKYIYEYEAAKHSHPSLKLCKILQFPALLISEYYHTSGEVLHF